MSVAFIQVRPPGYFTHISTTTPIVFVRLEKLFFLEVPWDILNHFWIQVAVSEVKRPLRNRFASEAVKTYNGYM
jgi:hypothetical protein